MRRTAIAILVALSASVARADFDPQVGRVVFDDAVVSASLDDLSSLSAFGAASFLSLVGQPMPPTRGGFVIDTERSLEGYGFLELGRESWGAVLGLDEVAARLHDRRVEVKIWVRPDGTIPSVDLLYHNTSLPFAEGAVPYAVHFFPTGRATSDGWRELSTGDVDFTLRGAFTARAIQIRDQRVVENGFFGFQSNDEGRTQVDGLAIYDRGGHGVPDAICTLPDEQAACGVLGTCFMGRCVDSAVVLGNIPRDTAILREYVDILVHRMRIVLGGRYPLSTTDGFASSMLDLGPMRTVAEHWSTFRRAFDDLGDGHVSAPPFAYPLPFFGDGACIHRADADLTPGGGQLPMVFERDVNDPVGAYFEVGDVVLAVDGLTPEGWLARADRYLNYSGDPRGRAFVITSQLLSAALRTGATLEMGRCAGPEACTAATLQRYQVPLRELTESFFSGSPLEWRDDDLGCDYRFVRDVPSPARDYDFVGHGDRDGIRTIVINGVSGSGPWLDGVQRAVTDLPDRVILDERTGFGGTFEGVSAVLEPFLSFDAQPMASLIPQLDPELDEAGYQVLMACQNGVDPCGNFFTIPLTFGLTPRAVAPEARVAILNAFDVSGNDYLPRALVDRPNGETRVFAPVPSFGAFGPILYLPRILDEVYGGTAQLHDTIFLWEPSFNTDFQTGHGVEPHVVIQQKQSDAVAGRDTLIEAARAWLSGAP